MGNENATQNDRNKNAITHMDNTLNATTSSSRIDLFRFELENVNDENISSFLLLISELENENNDTSILHDCEYCKKRISDGYQYKCLECDAYYLCNQCFEKRRSNYSHEKGHKMIRYDEKTTLFGKKFKDYEVNLDNLKKHFKDEIHQDIKCNICNKEPIKGLRFKCDICFDFNVCENCVSKSLGRHKKGHPLLAICKTFSSEIEYDQIEIDEDKWLGEGAFGKVYKAKFKKNFVACKIIGSEEITSIFTESTNSEYEEIRKSYMRELQAYNEIKSDNILKMIGYCINKKGPLKELVILTEFMEKGSLTTLLRNEPNLSYKTRFSIAVNIAAGLAKMHKIGFIHRDIRPENILVNAQYVAKIGDMGIAKVFYLLILL